MICKKCKVHSILIFNILTFLQPIKFLLRNCESVTISLRKFRFFFFISNVPLVSYQFSFFVFSNDVIEKWTGLCQNNEAMALDFFRSKDIDLNQAEGDFLSPLLKREWIQICRHERQHHQNQKHRCRRRPFYTINRINKSDQGNTVIVQLEFLASDCFISGFKHSRGIQSDSSYPLFCQRSFKGL